jgi:NAD(P)H-hydrate repair Nnr-like enzyme with NAD(P)H-hydrate epimerase domain
LDHRFQGASGTRASARRALDRLSGYPAIDSRFSFAKVVAVDIPSSLSSNMGDTLGEFVRAEHIVTFTAYRVSQILPPDTRK